jgi:hypothetical protein
MFCRSGDPQMIVRRMMPQAADPSAALAAAPVRGLYLPTLYDPTD